MDLRSIIKHRPGKVFVAISGGVDSATAAAMLLRAGFDCRAVYMKLYNQGPHKSSDAERVAKHLGIPFEILDLRDEFKSVCDYFCSEYKQARTPNPCVFCNRHIKFGKFFEYAKSKGADYIATGHYAQTIEQEGDFYLYAARNMAKDQSYMLAMINRDVLKNVIFPTGKFDKNQIRQMAETFGLEVSTKSDSQEICFIPDNDYKAKLESMCPELVRQGNVIDSSNKILGTHNGIHNFTIGQRKGLGIAMGQPWYVTKLDAVENTVTLGPEEELLYKGLVATEPNWLIEKPTEAFAVLVKTRYNDVPVPGCVYPGGQTVKIIFDEPAAATTPGQAAVFYLKDEKGLKVAGAGWIKEAFD
ncbi:MAG: tRNA 2-thiouridine(34) synthase MnmA [Sedimentisphaerales bacterium]|nr:tRNA 2-thiouridine(34) synthase MnmA [Sedimentisphaerales bacterium]